MTLAASLLAPASAWAGMPHGGSVVGRQPACTTPAASDDRAALWAPPLDRIVTIRLEEGSVRDAIDRLATAARVELSYSAELLPTTRRACLVAARVPVGAVLETLLAGTGLRPIVLASTQVVLAPSRVSRGTREGQGSRHASVLDRVVVTGSPDGAPQRGSPFALDVIDGAQLSQHGAGTLGEALDLSVPGIWTWANAAGSITARYGSIRGASSFGVSAPKLYLDGIEVANPLLVTQLDPARIARVEVIRGPQGAALYGADAISGVVNILTRSDGTSDGRAQRQISATAGVSNTAYAPRDPLVQEHAASLRRGSPSRSLGMGLTLGTVGAFVPGASERRLLADANARVTRDHAVLSGTARLSLQQANASTEPVPDGGDDYGVAGSGQDVAHYTVGGNVAIMPSLRWTHTIIAGVDGYRVRGLSAAALPGPLQASSAAQIGDSDGAADRASLRFRSVGRFDLTPATLLTLTLGAEQAITGEVLGRASASVLAAPRGGGTGAPGPGALTRPLLGASREQTTYANHGLLAQGVMAWHDRWFLSAGARVERTTGATPLPQQSVLPMLGATYVRDLGGAAVKLRGAYGTGIRPARTLVRNATWMGAASWASAANLEAERQSGTEFGGDVLVGSRLSLHLTRFDQRAAGLIQPPGAPHGLHVAECGRDHESRLGSRCEHATGAAVAVWGAIAGGEPRRTARGGLSRGTARWRPHAGCAVQHHEPLGGVWVRALDAHHRRHPGGRLGRLRPGGDCRRARRDDGAPRARWAGVAPVLVVVRRGNAVAGRRDVSAARGPVAAGQWRQLAERADRGAGQYGGHGRPDDDRGRADGVLNRCVVTAWW
jgi:hypothetical protein